MRNKKNLDDIFKDCKINISGLENIENKGNTIYIANHICLLDAFLIPYVLKRKCVVLVSSNSLFGKDKERINYINDYLYAFPIEPRAKKPYSEICLEGATKLLEDGYDLLIFPQGVFDVKQKVNKARTGAIRILFDAINDTKKIYNIIPIGIDYKNLCDDKLSLKIWDDFEVNINILPKFNYNKYYNNFILSSSFENKREVLHNITDDIMKEIACSLNYEYVDKYNSLYEANGFRFPSGKYIKFDEANNKELYKEYQEGINKIINELEENL